MDYLEQLFKFHLDTQGRSVYLFNEINPEVAGLIIKSLHYLDNQDGEIKLIINSPGGDIDSGNGIVDTILSLRNKVHAIVTGEASSMAVDVLLACDKRSMTERSTILIHAGSALVEGDMQSIKNRSASLQDELKRSIEFYVKRIKIGKNKLQKLLATDTIMDSKTALKYGFVDEVLEPKKVY